MRISTRLKLAVLVPALIAIAVVGALVYSFLDLTRIQRNGDSVRQVRNSITEINHLVFSYVLYHEGRPGQQLLAEQENLARLLSSLDLQDPEQLGLQGRIRNASLSISDLFTQATANYERGNSVPADEIHETEDRLVGMLLLQSYEADSAATQLRRLLDESTSITITSTTGLILIVLMLATIPLTVVLIRTRKGILTSLSNLAGGAAAVGSGNLDYRVVEGSNDELGDLSRTFNDMTLALKTITASKAELEREIKLRREVEHELEVTNDRLQQEKDKLTKLVESIPDEVWFADNDGNFTLANPSALREFGINPSVPLRVDEMIQRLEVFRPDGTPRPAAEAPPLRALKGEIVIDQEEIVQTPATGELRYRQVSAAPVRDSEANIIGAVSVVRDITRHKKADNDLRKSEEKYRSLNMTMTEGVCLHDIIYDESGQAVDYRLIDINPAYESITGLKKEDVIGKKASEVYGTGTAPYLDIYARVVASGKAESFETYFIPMSRHFAISVFSPAKGSFATVFSDITERKRIEQMKDDFIGMVSHEIKTPLTVIIGSLSVAMEEGVSENEARELIQSAYQYAENLAGITENLLELSRFQSKRLNLQPVRSNIAEISDKVIEKLSARAYRGHRLIVDVPANLPAVIVDPLRIERVIYNLLENAIKYSPDGGDVRIFSREQNSELVVGISDQGIGIGTEDQPRLFKSFERLNAYEEYSIPGLGLGLRVCDTLVKAHGGRIWLESEKGKGSTFYFSIPMDRKVQSSGQ